MAQRLPSSTIVRFWPYDQVPLSRLLNCNMGNPERPATEAVSTLASAVSSVCE